MELNKKTEHHRKDIAISTDNQPLNHSQVVQSSPDKKDAESPSKLEPKPKSQPEIIKEYQKKISAMQSLAQHRSQTILKLTKKNQDQRQEFKVLNEKLNKAFSKLTPSKLKNTQEKSEDTILLAQQLQRVKKDLENEMKKSKQLKKELQLLKETQNLLNNQNTFVQLKNQLVQKSREIKELKETVRVYERAEESEKKMTHFKKEEELNKKLHQLNEENIYMKKKVTELKAKIQDYEKVKAMEKAQAVLEKSIKPKKQTDSQQWVKKEVHDQEVAKLQDQIKIYESIKSTLEKTHKQECDGLKKQNQMLNDVLDELRMEIKKKNKEKLMLQQRTQQLSEMKKSRVEQERSSLTIDVDDKNQRYKTFSLNLKPESDISTNGLRKEFLGLSYGNFGNEYQKHDDSLKLDESRPFTISSLKFVYFEEHILSLKVKYKYANNEEVQLFTFNLDHSYTNVKTAQLTFQDHEYIKELDIYCNKMVEFIQLKTSRNQTLEIGNEKNQVKAKKYTFDIKNHEKPVAFGCITELKKNGDTKKECLVVLGLIIKKKDISINKKRLLFTSKQQLVNQGGSMTDRSLVKDRKSVNLNEDKKNDSLMMSFGDKEKEKITVKEKEKQKEKGKAIQNDKNPEKTVDKGKEKKQDKGQKIQKVQKAQKEKDKEKQKQKEKTATKTSQQKPAEKQKSPQKSKTKLPQPKQQKSSDSPNQQKSKTTLKR